MVVPPNNPWFCQGQETQIPFGIASERAFGVHPAKSNMRPRSDDLLLIREQVKVAFLSMNPWCERIILHFIGIMGYFLTIS